MVSLVEVTEYNYHEICSLEVSTEQESYVAPAVSILVRDYNEAIEFYTKKEERNTHAVRNADTH